MIITITCNPAIDKTVYEDKTVFDVGGKGINVSKVLRELNTKSIATGFIGKDNKDIIIDELNKLNIENHFIEVDGKVRTNTKTIINGKLIENNENGPYISEEDISRLFEYLKSFNNEIVVISGSISKNVDTNIYKDMVKLLKDNDNYVIADCKDDYLKNVIDAKPDVIKPNKQEACKLFNCEYNEDEIISRFKSLGLNLVCMSLGDEGAIFIGDEVYKCGPHKLKCLSSVGAGDAMVAGLAYGKQNNLDIKDTIKLAMACSAASCTTEGTKPAKYAVIKDFIDKPISL